MEAQFNRLMVERGHNKSSQSPSKADLDRQEFYRLMGDTYDPQQMKKHKSPTKRLI